MRRLINLIRSLKLSLGLMVAVIPVIAIGNIVPQEGRVSPVEVFEWKAAHPTVSALAEATGLHHLYTTWWFIAIFIVMFLNMGLVTWRLIGKTRRKTKGLHRFTDEAPDYFLMGTYPADGDFVRSFERSLRRKGYGITSVGGEIYARKGWIGIWGGTILHIGLVVVFLGAALSGLTRFTGFKELGVGQSFSEQEDEYFQWSAGPLFPGHRPEVAIFLEGMEVRKIGRTNYITSTITLRQGGRHVVTKTISMNEPLWYEGMKIYQSRATGPALVFSAGGVPGMSIGYVNLDDPGGEAASADFSIPGSGLRATASYLPVSDEVFMEIRLGDAMVYRGPVGAGQALDLENTKLTLLDVRRWTGLIVVYDWAVPIIFSGFALIIIGVFVMALFDPRELWAKKVERDGAARIDVLGWGRWRNMFKDEYDGMLRGMG